MASARVVAVSTGREADIIISRRPARSAIDKRPAAGPVRVGVLGLDGDQQADTKNHGGPEQAVYAYAREDLDWWAERLGTAVVQVASPRIPCATFQAWMGEKEWVRRFAAAGRPGACLRVLREGAVHAGDVVEVLDRPAQRVTVAEAMLAFYGDAGLLRRLLTVEGRGMEWDEVAAKVLGREAS